MKFSVFQASRRGGREKNEDRMGYCYTRGSALFVLADGMGGHPEGEVAAQLALQAMSALFQRQARPRLPDVRAFLAEAVLAAHQQLLRYASGKGMLDNPRTTLVAAVVQDGRAQWVHCGDSRLYLVRGGALLARTQDHSYAELRRMGAIDHEGVNRSVLFSCLGSPTRPHYDLADPVPLAQGDRILLCSDGLWSSVSDETIARELGRHVVAQAVPELVEQALRTAREHSDNVTAVALEWQMPAPDAAADFASTISTESIGDGMFESTMQAEPVDAIVDDLDDEAIERSIAEINEAIRRTAARRA